MRDLLFKAKQLAGKKINKNFIAAAAYSKKGNLIDVVTNEPSYYPGNRLKHAEGKLMLRYGRKISKIIILRVGHGGAQRPIEPCETCAKFAMRLGIRIEEMEVEE